MSKSRSKIHADPVPTDREVRSCVYPLIPNLRELWTRGDEGENLWPLEEALTQLEAEVFTKEGCADERSQWKNVLHKIEQLKRGSLDVHKVQRICRSFTNTLQTHQPLWKKLEEILGIDGEIKALGVKTNVHAREDPTATFRLAKCDAWEASQRIACDLQSLKAARKQAEDEYFELLRSEANENDSSVCFISGPVGNSPVHDCFLLGLFDIGERVIDLYYTSPEKLSIPYFNDLKPWRGEKKPEDWEDGLYTGETLLHIAIVKDNIEVIERLLYRGIDLSSRATGAFFQPKWIRPRVVDLGWLQRLKATVAGVDFVEDKFAPITQADNAYSACYYGEIGI